MWRIFAAAMIMLSSAAHAQTAPPAEMATAAALLASQFASTWNAADGAAYGQAYWQEAELVDPSGRIWDGRSAIVQTHLDLWKRGKSTARTIVRRVRPLSDRLMVVDITATVCGFSQLPLGARADAQGCVWSNLKHVVEKRGSEWKIIASQNTFTRPPN